ncbi:MAG: hypothetical protein IJJ00_08175 [Erysipelotrichaceae bacterium]|nr:hypothetical protein [Erysipelotrichaceae bacterium]
MKKVFLLLLVLCMGLVISGFSYENDSDDEDPVFSIDELYDYQKEFKSEEIKVCASGTAKTYMDYRSTTARDSRQYWFIHDELTVDKETGFLYDEDGFIGAALGSFYGEIGDRFYFTLDSGVVLPIVKCEEKADWDTDYSNCYHLSDNSVIEFVIDKNYALNYFGRLSNDYILNGNYNNYHLFKGAIVKVEKVLDEKREDYVTFEKNETVTFDNYDIFNYASGY